MYAASLSNIGYQHRLGESMLEFQGMERTKGRCGGFFIVYNFSSLINSLRQASGSRKWGTT
jgi:hypothetical protein